MIIHPQLLVDCRSLLGEGPIFYNNQLIWIDIRGKLIHTANPDGTNHQSHPVPQMIGFLVPTTQDNYIAGLQDNLYTLDQDFQNLTPYLPKSPHDSTMRFNDGKTAPNGTLHFGSMDIPCKLPTGKLYSITHHQKLNTLAQNTTVSNGLAWTSDQKTMYYIDTPTFKVDKFDYNPSTGLATNRQTAFTIPEHNGRPDGMAIDTDNNLWIAHFGGSQVICYNPKSGEELHTIPVPANAVTSCTFGGPDHKTLYITTAAIGTPDDQKSTQPHAGSLFIAHPPAQGHPITLAKLP